MQMNEVISLCTYSKTDFIIIENFHLYVYYEVGWLFEKIDWYIRKYNQGSFCVWAQAMRDDVTM